MTCHRIMTEQLFWHPCVCLIKPHGMITNLFQRFIFLNKKTCFIPIYSHTLPPGNITPFNPRPAGPLDFPPPAGGGGAFERPPPMISAPGRRREKRKVAFESSRKIISKSFRSFFGSGQNWSLQGSKFQNFPKRFFDNKIFNFKNRATNLIPSCLSR